MSETKKRLQCKDIPEIPILKHLSIHGGIGCSLFGFACEECINDKSLFHAMPLVKDYNLALAKIKQMVKKDMISGCCCGCRGDFELTEKGKLKLSDCDE
tara:strand:+ start:277 stop:573 length:297 start_codon:yes stop_codon:yes gene_type:complete